MSALGSSHACLTAIIAHCGVCPSPTMSQFTIMHLCSSLLPTLAGPTYATDSIAFVCAYGSGVTPFLCVWHWSHSANTVSGWNGALD